MLGLGGKWVGAQAGYDTSYFHKDPVKGSNLILLLNMRKQHCNILKYFVVFSLQKIGFDISCKLGDNLHKIS